MGYIKQNVKPCTHPTRPRLGKETYAWGDIWECDDCKVHFHTHPGPEDHDFRGEPCGRGDNVWREYPYVPEKKTSWTTYLDR